MVTFIAFVAVGRVVRELESERVPAVYDLHDAAQWIGDRLPVEVAARLSYNEVAQVLGWHMDWFHDVGAASRFGEELATDSIRTDGAVAPDEAAIDAVVARSFTQEGPDAVDIVCILDLQMRYLGAIGAIGGIVGDPAD